MNTFEVKTRAIGLMSAPVTGSKTVSAVAAEMFAGEAALAKRRQMIVTNNSAGIVYWGASTVTALTGMPVASGDSVIFDFDPNTAIAIYFIAESELEVRVVEFA
jgi:hypothetical protein